MAKFPDLHLYIPNRQGAVTHIVRQYPDGNIYIFCNRYFGEASGQIFIWAEADTPTYSQHTICSKCHAAIETAIERSAVLAGLRPPSLAD